MRRSITWGGVSAAILLASVVGLAQITRVDWQTGRDWGLAVHPCGAVGLKGAAQPVVINGAVHVLYTCGDDRVIAREFAVLVEAPAPPPPADCSHIPGFVSTIDGSGCVPPDHPLARR